MMKILIISLCLFPFSGMADDDSKLDRKQKIELRKANAYLKLGHPQLAAPIYTMLYDVDSSNREIVFGLGISLM